MPFPCVPRAFWAIFKSIKHLSSVPLIWVVNHDSLKVSPSDRAICREALPSGGKTGQLEGPSEGLRPCEQQPGTGGKSPEQHADPAPRPRLCYVGWAAGGQGTAARQLAFSTGSASARPWTAPWLLQVALTTPSIQNSHALRAEAGWPHSCVPRRAQD